jgi:hypothetical protein
MMYKELYKWVEGSDDERFFKSIVVPTLERLYTTVTIQMYANMRIERVNQFIQSIKSIPTSDYLFFTDIDATVCITKRKGEVKAKYAYIDLEKVVIVVREIESWYLAGLSETMSQQLKVKFTSLTDNVTKEKFYGAMPKKYKSRIDYLVEITKRISTTSCIQRNTSFSYFAKKHLATE